jgi:hypothetical protein
MQLRTRLSICVAVVIAIGLALPSGAKDKTPASDDQANDPKTVTYDHKNQVLNPSGPVPLARGDILTINVTNTYADCFQFPITALTQQQETGKERSGEEPYVTIPVKVRYNGKASGYKFSIKFRSDLTEDRKKVCQELGEVNEVLIEVENLGWTLGFAGAFTADRLVDPVYFLEPGTGKVNGTDTAGFNVRQNKSANDTAVLGTAAMVHLYHSDPNRYPLLGGNWAPVTFGLAVGSESKTKYYLGTSLRYDTHLYLTGGIAFGPIKRLPNSLDTGAHSFTTSATALDNLPTRNKAALFFSVSYTFLGNNLQGANGPFMSAFSGSGNGGTGQAKVQSQGGQPTGAIDLKPASAKPGETIEITPKSGDFGESTDTDSSVKVGEAAVQKASELGNKWTKSKITLTVPPVNPGPDVNVTVTKGKETFGTKPLKIEEAALTVEPPTGKAGTKITIKPPKGVQFGGPAERSSVKFGSDQTIESRTITDRWTDTAIKDLPVPQRLPKGKVKIVVMKEGQEAGSFDFEITQ